MSVNAPWAPGEPSHGSESSFRLPPTPPHLGCSYLTRALLQLHSRETRELRRGGCCRPPACLSVCLPPPLVQPPTSGGGGSSAEAGSSATDRQDKTAELRLSPPEPLQSFDSALVQHWQRTQSHQQARRLLKHSSSTNTQPHCVKTKTKNKKINRHKQHTVHNNFAPN